MRGLQATRGHYPLRMLAAPRRLPRISPAGTGLSSLATRASRARQCSYTDAMGAVREQLHHLVDEIPEADVRRSLS